MKRTTLILAAVTGMALASNHVDRVLKIESKNFTGDLRNGPYTFTGTDANPIKATVSSLRISAPKVVMAAPAGTPITSAEGKRTADFTGGVTVMRGRLTAKGPSLKYSEVTGEGDMQSNPSAVFAPESKEDDPVNITASSMNLDVDTDISTSKGNVKLVSGSQTGRSSLLIFDEKRELGVLTGNVTMNRAADGKKKALAITGEEARVLTKNKLTYVKGKVKLVSGDVTTTGDALYYDDQKETAVVVGSPAKSVNSRAGTTVSSGVIEHRTDVNRVRQLSGGYKMPAEQFRLSTEQ